MNREERRKALKNGASYKAVIDTSLNDAFEAGFKAGMRHTVDVVMLMTAYTIHYKYNMGKKRLPELMEAINNNITSFATGQLNQSDLPHMVEEVSKAGVIFDTKMILNSKTYGYGG